MMDPGKMELDPDRSLLEQIEELAEYDDEARRWLYKMIYDKPAVLGLFHQRIPPESLKGW